MFSKIKTYIIYILAILLLLIGSYALIQKHKAAKLKAQKENLQTELQVKTKGISTYKNKLNQVVTETLEYKKSIDELRISKDSIEKSLYNVYKASNLKDRQIKSLTKIIANGGNSGVLQVDTIRSDTVYLNVVKTFSDSLISIICKNDSVSYDINLKVDILTAARLIPRKFQPFKWINKNWTLKKKINKNKVQVLTNVPNSKVIIRQIKSQ